ncbi:MAG: hypothetical protein GY943_28130 [Chloroflexi bacterium]|nr:hypothetical protein [Chloroflexota bacterium]
MNELGTKESGIHYKYSFDEHCFYTNWKHGCDEGTTSVPLDQLSSHYSLTQGRPDGFVAKWQKAGAFIAIAIIVYFSDFNESIPLLAPAFFIYGVVKTISMWGDLIPKTWSVISYKDGKSAGSIIHDGNSEERIKFEEALACSIRSANEISS